MRSWLGARLFVSARTRYAALVVLAALCSAPAIASPGSTPSGQIVFSSDRAWFQAGEIYVARPGVAPRDVSDSAYADFQMAVSPRGDLIAFWSTRSGKTQVYVARPDGSHLRALRGTQQTNEQSPQAPVFSADGRTLIISRILDLGRARFRVEVMAADAASATAHGFLAACNRPEPSPDATLVACHPKLGSIEVYDRAGKRQFRLPGQLDAWSRAGLAVASEHGYVTLYDTRGRRLHRYPGSLGAWSSDGRLLALGRGTKLVLQTVGGRARLLYAHAEVDPYSTRFTPDGRGVAFNGGPTGTLLVPVDGGKPRAITGSGSWSPDGRRYAYFQVPDGPLKPGVQTSVRIGNRYGARSTVVGHFLYDNHGNTRLVWLPDGSGVLYETSADTAGSDLYAVSADGSGNPRRLSTDPRDEGDPTWSPDGKRLVFAQSDFAGSLCQGCSRTLWLSDPDLTTRTPLTSGPRDDSFDTRPSFSPAGDAVAYIHATFDAAQVNILTLDGSPPVEVPNAVGLPAWSPGGIVLALCDQRGVEMVAPTGGVPRLLVALPCTDRVAWSPDGTKLAITTNDGLYIAPADGSAAPQPLAHVTNAEHPSFSPDGRWIAFGGDGTDAGVFGGPQFDIMIVGLDGSGLRTLATSPFSDVDPVWQP